MGEAGLLLYMWANVGHAELFRHMASGHKETCSGRWRCDWASAGACWKWLVVPPGQGENSAHRWLALRSGRRTLILLRTGEGVSPLVRGSARPLLCGAVNDPNETHVATPGEAEDRPEL